MKYETEFAIANIRKFIAIQPGNVCIIQQVLAGSWAVEGIGEDFVPEIADLSRVAEAYTIEDAESFATARELLRKEGILAGSSTGTL